MGIRGKGKWILGGLILLIVFFLHTIVTFYTEILWYKEVDYLSVFWKILFTNTGIRIAQIAVFALFFFLNFLVVKKALLFHLKREMAPNVIDIGKPEGGNSIFKDISSRAASWFLALISIIMAIIFSAFNPQAWRDLLFYLNRTDFGVVEPILGQDAGFYVFQLPFLRFLFESGLLMLGVTLVILGVIYVYLGRTSTKMVNISTSGQKHLCFLGGLFLLLRGWGYRLDMHMLLFSREGVVFGPGYVDANIKMPVLNILSIMLLVMGVILLISIFLRTRKHVPVLIVAWLLVAFLAGTVYPGIIQRLRVEPNEIALEEEFIANNIRFTNYAFGLDNIREVDFPLDGELDWATVEENRLTIDNLRIWDWRPILETYRQLEERRPYYVFNRVDIDRYVIDGEYQQVMLAPRELDQNLLPERAKTWVNQALRYTHGMGMVLNPVSNFTSEGFPEFYIRDIPPASVVDLTIENPAIYYGESAPEYVVANNEGGEFHYPRGDDNVYVHYEGIGGIPVDNFMRRLAFALRFRSIQILLASDITAESRVMFDRIIHDRVRKIAPFLQYDQDPYTVIHDGRIFWIQDAYTISSNFPYSEPYGQWGNYVRNSVKIVIDAYNGTVEFYIIDEDDPIIQTYDKIFPDLFKSIDEMPQGLENHLRYPEDFFTLQSRVLTTYHMKDSRVFYNREDQWDLPRERYGDRIINMTPYYTLLQLPGEDELEFVLMLPFTPVGRNNMVAWMAALCDPGRYGELVLYHFPKDRLAFGPMQIEARIDQDGEISRQISLWDQRGSRVIRGNLLVIPIGGTVLYVEPLFLESEEAQIPQVRRVIMAAGDKVVMEETVEDALRVLVGERIEEELPAEIEKKVIIDEEIYDVFELVQRVGELFQEAQQALRDGNWSEYGQLQEDLEEILNRLSKIIEEEF